MSTIFDAQNLPQDEIWALNRYIENVRKTSSESEYLFAKYRMVSPYFLLNETDTILQITQETYEAFKRIDDNQNAAIILGPTIHIYIEKGFFGQSSGIFAYL